MSVSSSGLVAVVLAAGKGKRMKSDLPKVLHKAAGKSLLEHVLDTLQKIDVDRTVVVIGHRAEQVRQAIRRQGIEFVEQTEQLGTGHAVQMAESALSGFTGRVLVLAGDVPLLRPATLRNLIGEHARRKAAATVLTAILPDPTGYGRIIRDKAGMILKIVEHKDATEAERQIAEINTGTFVFEKEPLFRALGKVNNRNSQGEYYLTDVMKIFLEEGIPTAGCCAEDYRETVGVNSPEELSALDQYLLKAFSLDKD
jgi:bifunctional UDP-N-acetylglucosamine pyrophosphorylase/glucosamine-1-phosphate N-acetyltransferase